jgi:N4-gp56 family major capsid protein
VASTTVTTYAPAISRIDEKKLLAVAEGMLGADKFAVKRPVEKGAGNSYRVTKILRQAKQTTAGTFGVAGIITYSSAKALTAQTKSITPILLADYFSIDDDVDIKSWIKDSDNRDTIANQMARSHDYYVMKVLAQGGFRYRIDGDGTYMKSGTVTTASAGGTALYGASTLTETDDFWNGGFATIYNPEGPNYDETSAVTDFATSGDVATVSFPNGLTTSSKYHITVGTALAATDILTIAGLLKVSALHRKFETEKFSGGVFRAFFDAAQEADLWADTTFLNSAIYDNSERFKNYRVGRWLDIEFMVSSEAYREDVDGTENQATGVVYATPIFGANAYTVMRWGHGSGDFGVKFLVVDQPDSGNILNSFRIISWKSVFAASVLRATSVINLMTGATSLGI